MDKKIEYIREHKNQIINYYSNTMNLEELYEVLYNLNNTDIISPELDEIKAVVSNRLDGLNPKTITQVVGDLREENSFLSDFNIIESPREMNDLDNYGFKSDMYYLQVSFGNDKKMYEIDQEHLKDIRIILNDKKSMKNITKEKLLEKLKPYIKELENIDMDYKTNLDKSTIDKEISQIYDNEVRKAFVNNINDVIKERKMINEYMKNKGFLRENLSYSLNSKGERLYNVGNQVIKFVGKDREMVILSNGNNEKEKEDIPTVKDDKKESVKKPENSTNSEVNTGVEETELNEEEKEEINNNLPNTLEEFDTENYTNSINYTLEKIYTNIPLTEYETEIIHKFLELCAYSNENDIPLSLYDSYDKYFNFLCETEDYYDAKISEIFKDKVKEKKEKEEKKETLEEENVRKLILKHDEKDNNNLGFVNIVYIVCSIVVILVIVLYFLLVK